jgi:vacuolar-type H+-ATPase subunit F/Vma7
LDGTKASADKLVNLIGGKTPELLSNVRGKIRNDLQGLDAAKTQQYLQNKSGLFETFPELRKSVEELAANRLQAEKLDRMFSGQGKRYSDALNVTQSAEELVGQKAAKTLGEGSAYQDLKIGLEQLEKAQGADIVTVSKTIANTLREKELIDADKYQQMLTYINDVGNNAQKAADLKKLVKRIALGGSIFGGADYAVRKALGLQ